MAIIRGESCSVLIYGIALVKWFVCKFVSIATAERFDKVPNESFFSDGITEDLVQGYGRWV